MVWHELWFAAPDMHAARNWKQHTNYNYNYDYNYNYNYNYVLMFLALQMT